MNEKCSKTLWTTYKLSIDKHLSDSTTVSVCTESLTILQLKLRFLAEIFQKQTFDQALIKGQ